MEKQKTKTFYVGLKNSVELRRDILGSSKDIVKCMESNKTLRERREAKLQLLKKIKKDIEEMDFLLEKLMEMFPKNKIEMYEEVKPKEKDLPKIEKSKPQVQKEGKQVKQLKKIEQQLYDLEKKIDNL